MSNQDKLKPCPFCGSTDVVLTRDAARWPVAQCQDCGANGPSIKLSSDEAVVQWNARAALAAQEAEPVARWTIEYDNDTGPNDEGFEEWWNVVNDDRSFRCNSKEDAEWLCGRLNAAPPAREAVALPPHEKDRPDQGSRYVEGYGYVDAAALRAVERAVWQAHNLREPT